MLLIFLSLFFCWLIYRELRSPAEGSKGPVKGYILTLSILAIACAWPAIKTYRLEAFLSEKASIIAERPNIKVKCNSIFGSIFNGQGLDNNLGTARISQGEIFFENNWCSNFQKYLSNPEHPSKEELIAMHVFTHEVMHVRGEKNEKKTDCQAIQRNHHVGELLGIDPNTARRNAKKYYNTYYKQHPYHSKHCVRKGKFDERLDDPIWG